MDSASLLVSLLVSSIGLGIFLYGRRQTRIPHVVCGLLLMVLPYLAPGVVPDLLGAVGIVGALWLATRFGW